MQIKLNDKTYTTKVIKARMVRKSIELTEGVSLDKMTTKDLDKMVDFIVEVFDNQFTSDDIYDGLCAKDLIPTISSTIQAVVNGINDEFNGVEVKK